MSDTHDFNDGNGPVPAHRHSNGGGWVAETAKVDESAHVGPDAKVYGDAKVYDNARVHGYAQVYGNAWVSGNAWVYGNARVHGYAQVYGNACVYSDDNAAKIAELTRKLDALRNEVRAWRDADDSREEERLPWSKAQAICKAMDATDTLNALEDVR